MRFTSFRPANPPLPLAFAAVLAAAILALPACARAADAVTPFDGGKSTWHNGFDRYDFVMDEASLEIKPFTAPASEKFGIGNPAKGQRRCIVVAPKAPAPGNPWSWRGCYWDHQPQTEVELLRRGFYIAFITPDPGRQWDAWYRFLTEQHGFSKKPAFIGMSKGGVNEYDWATGHPDDVSCIYADNPAIRPEAFMKLGDLAKNDVALLNICGSFDFLLQKHTLAIEDRYQQLGGRITLMIKDGTAHHPHSLRNPKPIADWIVQHMHPETDANRPDFADASFVKSYYYSLENSYNYLKEEDTYATCRGPGFAECYERYDATTASQWGIGGMTIIAPKSGAPGKPWVFRADALHRDATVDQALLAKGFHIVVPPLTAQSGPVQEQWDATYNVMTTHGFSKKPVMEGTGTAAGDAYAWAIANPDKVSCVYGRNPALRSLMTNAPPMDNLAPLAKAGVPLLHVCGSVDPWLDSQTRVLEKRYKELGGQITVIIAEGEGHFPLEPKDPKPVVDFILAKTSEQAAASTTTASTKTPSTAVPKLVIPQGGSGQLFRVEYATSTNTGSVGLKSEPAAAVAKDFHFDYSISREVLENYLSRSISFTELLHDDLTKPRNSRGVDPRDNLRFILETKAKFVGRALMVWGREKNLAAFLQTAKPFAERLHEGDPEIVLQAAAFEIVTKGVESLAIPDPVFAEFGQPVTNRNFRYDEMLYADGRFVNHWGSGASVPDMSKLETRMWFYYLASNYIDTGIEAIHFGQVGLMDKNDPGHAGWIDMLGRVRAYAHAHARRHFVICDAHTPTGGYVENGRLLFDAHAFPLRIAEVADHPHQGILKVGNSDSLYLKSKGGVTPSGWSCEHLPYLAEFDNFGGHNQGSPSRTPFIWGWDEITWFAVMPETERNEWLRYAWNWLAKTDPTGHLEMPGSRVLSPGKKGGPRWYWANTRSDACPDGFNTEETIKEIWGTIQ